MIVEALISFFDLIFSPLLVLKPHISLFIISSIIAVLVILANKFLVDRRKMEEIKRKMEEIRLKIAEAQKSGNKEYANKLLDELLKINTEQLKQSLKALIVTLTLISFILPWIKYRYEGMAVLSLPFSIPIIGSSFSWVVWYFLVSFVVSWILRKIFGV
ncbi:MAG: EMC3/TMCO1 family protein [Candidatus Aenigmatarchaeota archaeon]